MKTVKFQLEPLTCPSCIKKIEGKLGKMDGVEEAKVMFNASKVKATIDQDQVTSDEVKATIEKLGYPIFVGVDNKLAGVISIADQIRHDAIDTIKQLRAAGVKQTVMLTGDNKHTAEKVATQLGIDQVFAEMLPEDKVNHIKRLKAEGYKVAMVGDGINDASAIALADVGLAMGAAGTDAAMETADVVLMADKLDKIPYAYSLAKATVRNMKQNIFVAVGTVALLLAAVLLGKIFLASGMLIHELSVLIVILNAIRLVRYKQRGKRVDKEVGAAIPEVN